MWQVTRPAAAIWQTTCYTAIRTASSQPPAPRPWRPARPEERISRHPQPTKEAATEATASSKNLGSWLWPFASSNTETTPQSQASGAEEAPDPERGAEAAKKVVREGVLDPRYKAAARRWTAIICMTPVALVLTYVLFERRFLGKEQKQIPVPKPKKQGTMEVEGR